MMTPIVHYTIFYGTAKRKYLDDFLSVNTSDNTTISFILSGIVDLGNYSVGVAAVNSAGRSSVKFYEEFLGKYTVDVLVRTRMTGMGKGYAFS